MGWYRGPTLLEKLDSLPSRGSKADLDFRMPVQTVLKDGRDFRGLAGTITSGSIRVGDVVHDVLSQRSAPVVRISTMTGDLDQGVAGQAIALQLATDLDISRGAILARETAAPAVARELDVRLVWLSDTAFEKDRSLLLRTATDLVPVSAFSLSGLLNLETLTERAAPVCGPNDIALATLTLARPVAIDVFVDNRETGSFVLVDALTGATIAGGVVTAAREARWSTEGTEDGAFRLTRSLLAGGLCADLDAGEKDRDEFRRRAVKVATILSAAGVRVEIEEDYSI